MSIRQKSRSGRSSPLGSLIAALLFLGIGLAILAVGWFFVVRKTLEVRKWKPVPCQVTTWRVGLTPDGGTVYKPSLELEYTYEAGGKARTGTVLDATGSWTPTLNELEETGIQVKSGGQVCHVNPANPDEASLRAAGWTLSLVFLGFGLVFAGVGASILLSRVGALLRRVGSPPTPPNFRGGCLSALPMPIFCLVFAGAGIAVWKFAIHDTPDWKNIAPKMVNLPAEVVASGVDRHSSSGKNGKTTYSAKVAFRYEYGGRSWFSGWLDFDRGTVSKGSSSTAHEAAQRHPAGQKTTCWVNPSAPWQAVLEKEGGPRWWLWLLVVLFGGLGGIAFLISSTKAFLRFIRGGRS